MQQREDNRRICACTRSYKPATRGIDVYLAEEDAQHALEDCLRDEPHWGGSLWLEAVELDERDVSMD